MNVVPRNRLAWKSPVAAVLLSLVFVCPAGACEALRPDLRAMAKQLAKLLTGRSEDTIAVGAFTGPAHCPASAGPGIKRILIEELDKLKIRVKRQAALEVKGDYRDVMDRDSQLLALRLKAAVLERRSGDVIVELDRKVEDRDILAQVLGITRPDFGAGPTPRQESAELKKRIDRPSVDLRASPRIQADPKSKYAIEIYVKENGRYAPRKPAEDEGLAFVPIGKDEVFAVRLINDSDYDAAVELTLDGLSMFAFSDHPGYRHFVVPKRSSTLIKGWHRTNKLSDEFVITDYSSSAAKELLANPDPIGTITATFSAAWDPKAKPPEDEGSKFRDPFNPAVGRGQPVETPVREVVRQRGRVRDVISVRYKKGLP
jgi:hypothetical protein